MSSPPDAGTDRSSGRSRQPDRRALAAALSRWLTHAWVGPLLALLLVYGLFAALSPDTFAGSINLETMIRQTVVVAIAAVGMTLVMVQGGIDLSVGSVVALTTVVVASALRAGLDPMVALALGLLTGTLCGLANGVLVMRLRITPFIVTLATMSVLRGVAKGLAGEQKIDADAQGLDEMMAILPDDRAWMLVPPGIWCALLVAVLVALLLHYTRLGRHIVAVGSNPRAAALCGISLARITIAVYAIAGLLAGLAGCMEFATLTVGDPTDSVGLELEVIAAVVIGGGSLSGGQGSVAGTIVGALLMTVIKAGCTHVGVPNWVQEIVTGVIIATAVAIDRWRKQRAAV